MLEPVGPVHGMSKKALAVVVLLAIVAVYLVRR
jgi:hypothetical protein